MNKRPCVPSALYVCMHPYLHTGFTAEVYEFYIVYLQSHVARPLQEQARVTKD